MRKPIFSGYLGWQLEFSFQPNPTRKIWVGLDWVVGLRYEIGIGRNKCLESETEEKQRLRSERMEATDPVVSDSDETDVSNTRRRRRGEV